ncbi:MAG: MAPEG family protein [Caulobacter sp.]|nr:MAPEG family protein [Caulobacter sp.]
MMSQIEILWPVVAMVALTFFVLTFIPLRRFAAVRRGEVKADDFALGESTRVPAKVALANRNYMNLLELPVLFYVAAILLFVTSTVDPLVVQLAWAFVAARVVHSLIHITFNAVLLRLTVFAISNLVLIILWVMIGMKLWALRG